MFSELSKFAEEEFSSRHRQAWIWYDGTKHALDLLGYAELNAKSSSIYDVENNRIGHNAQILEQFGLKEREGRLVILSTCSRKARELRDVVIGVVLEK